MRVLSWCYVFESHFAGIHNEARPEISSVSQDADSLQKRDAKKDEMEHKRLVVHMLVFRTLDSLKVKGVKSYLVSSPSGKHHRRGIVPDTLNICFYHARWFLHISKKKKKSKSHTICTTYSRFLQFNQALCCCRCLRIQIVSVNNRGVSGSSFQRRLYS